MPTTRVLAARTTEAPPDALRSSSRGGRACGGGIRHANRHTVAAHLHMQPMQRPSTFSVEVNPAVPERIARLAELADNLWYAWDPSTRSLFARLDPELWRAAGQSPKALLKRVDES